MLLGRSYGTLKGAYARDRYRSAEPVLTLVLLQKHRGIIANVLFPTGIDWRDVLGSPGLFDVYYGIANNRIGVALLVLQDLLPPGGVADPPEANVQYARFREFKTVEG